MTTRVSCAASALGSVRALPSNRSTPCRRRCGRGSSATGRRPSSPTSRPRTPRRGRRCRRGRRRGCPRPAPRSARRRPRARSRSAGRCPVWRRRRRPRDRRPARSPRAGDAHDVVAGRAVDDDVVGRAVVPARGGVEVVRDVRDVGSGQVVDDQAVGAPERPEGDRLDVVALVVVDGVVAVAAEQGVVAVAAVERVVARAAVDREPDERGQVAGGREAVVAAVGVEDEVPCLCPASTVPGSRGRSAPACRWPSR
jgi:hypothetical protein